MEKLLYCFLILVLITVSSAAGKLEYLSEH